MNDEQQIDSVLEHMPEMPAALVDKIRAEIKRDTQPVKPLMNGATLATLFIAISVVASLIFAAGFKFTGVQALTATAAAELLLVLLLAAALSANTVARSMRPGAGKLHSWVIGGAVLLAYEVLVSVLFRSNSMAFLFSQGVKCFGLGVLCGFFVAVPVWLLVRRGFVVQPVLAGAGVGLLGGLAGITFLTLHCAIFEVPHAGIWHAAVVVFCVGSGALASRHLPAA